MKQVALLVVQLMNDKFAPTFLALSPNMALESTLVWAFPSSHSVRLVLLCRNVHGLHSASSDESENRDPVCDCMHKIMHGL